MFPEALVTVIRFSYNDSVIAEMLRKEENGSLKSVKTMLKMKILRRLLPGLLILAVLAAGCRFLAMDDGTAGEQGNG